MGYYINQSEVDITGTIEQWNTLALSLPAGEPQFVSVDDAPDDDELDKAGVVGLNRVLAHLETELSLDRVYIYLEQDNRLRVDLGWEKWPFFHNQPNMAERFTVLAQNGFTIDGTVLGEEADQWGYRTLPDNTVVEYSMTAVAWDVANAAHELGTFFKNNPDVVAGFPEDMQTHANTLITGI